VRKYIPELPVYDAPITIQNLLNHTSGLKDWGSVGSLTGWPRTTRNYTNPLAIHIIARQKTTNFIPGTQYSYSNSNYTLLTEIVERVSKKSLERFTDSVFFKPLGMTSTRWRDNFREIVHGRAIAYNTSSGKYEQLMPFENVHGHGGLLTTTHDLLKWNLLLADPSLVGERVNVWRKKQGVLKNGKRITYASGIAIGDYNGQPEISHSGATAGYRGWLAFYPKQKLSIIFLSNDSRFDIGESSQAIARIFLGQEKQSKKERKDVPLSSNELQKWNGHYRQRGDANYFSLKADNGKILSGAEVKTIHADTLLMNDWLKLTLHKNDLLSINGVGDTSTYKRVLPPDLAVNALKSLAGTYYSEEAEATFKIMSEGSEVYYWRDPNVKQKLKPAFKDAFNNEDYWLLEFLRDKKNQVIGINVSMDRAQRVPFKKIN
jgi:CubicO group peptidase (beta-lactamase class C family)